MHRMSLTPKGQLVIPKELRDKHGIKPSAEVIVTEIDNHIAVLPALDPIRQGRGMLRFDRPTAELLKEARAAEFNKDEQVLRNPGLKTKRKNVPKHR